MWKNSNPGRSNLTKHLLENKHSIISNVKEDIKILKYSEDGRIMPSWEGSLYVHKNKYQNKNLLINEQTKCESKIIYTIKIYRKL